MTRNPPGRGRRRPTTEEANDMHLRNRAPAVTLVYAAVVAATAALVAATSTRPPPAAPDPPPAVSCGPPAEVTGVIERIMAKTAVTQAVFAGQLSLPEAAAVFGWL